MLLHIDRHRLDGACWRQNRRLASQHGREPSPSRLTELGIPLFFSKNWTCVFVDALVVAPERVSLLRQLFFSPIRTICPRIIGSSSPQRLASFCRRALSAISYPVHAHVRVLDVLTRARQLLETIDFRQIVKIWLHLTCRRFDFSPVHVVLGQRTSLRVLAGHIHDSSRDLLSSGSFYDRIESAINDTICSQMVRLLAVLDINGNMMLSSARDPEIKDLWNQWLDRCLRARYSLDESSPVHHGPGSDFARVMVKFVFQSRFPFSDIVFELFQKSLDEAVELEMSSSSVEKCYTKIRAALLSAEHTTDQVLHQELPDCDIEIDDDYSGDDAFMFDSELALSSMQHMFLHFRFTAPVLIECYIHDALLLSGIASSLDLNEDVMKVLISFVQNALIPVSTNSLHFIDVHIALHRHRQFLCALGQILQTLSGFAVPIWEFVSVSSPALTNLLLKSIMQQVHLKVASHKTSGIYDFVRIEAAISSPFYVLLESCTGDAALASAWTNTRVSSLLCKNAVLPLANCASSKDLKKLIAQLPLSAAKPSRDNCGLVSIVDVAKFLSRCTRSFGRGKHGDALMPSFANVFSAFATEFILSEYVATIDREQVQTVVDVVAKRSGNISLKILKQLELTPLQRHCIIGALVALSFTNLEDMDACVSKALTNSVLEKNYEFPVAIVHAFELMFEHREESFENLMRFVVNPRLDSSMLCYCRAVAAIKRILESHDVTVASAHFDTRLASLFNRCPARLEPGLHLYWAMLVHQSYGLEEFARLAGEERWWPFMRQSSVLACRNLCRTQAMGNVNDGTRLDPFVVLGKPFATLCNSVKLSNVPIEISNVEDSDDYVLRCVAVSICFQENDFANAERKNMTMMSCRRLLQVEKLDSCHGNVLLQMCCRRSQLSLSLPMARLASHWLAALLSCPVGRSPFHELMTAPSRFVHGYVPGTPSDALDTVRQHFQSMAVSFHSLHLSIL